MLPAERDEGLSMIVRPVNYELLYEPLAVGELAWIASREHVQCSEWLGARLVTSVTFLG